MFNSDKSKRRTKTVLCTTDPKWNQTFVYPLSGEDRRERTLEITVWDYDRIGASQFLGEVMENTITSSFPSMFFLFGLNAVKALHLVVR